MLTMMRDAAISFPLLGNWSIDPSASFTLFGRTFYWYGVIIAVGFILAMLYCARHCRRCGIEPDTLYDFLIWMIPLAIIGARLYYVIFQWSDYRGHPIDALKIWEGGLAIYGGVIAGLGGNNLVVVGIGIALKCLGSSPACYLILAMLADVIDHVEYKHGIRTDGLTMSIYSSLMVAATPIGGAIIQALNGMLDAGTAASVNYIWIETIAYAVCAVLMIFFGVERNLKAEQQEIANRVSK